MRAQECADTQGRTPLLAAIVMSHADVVNNLLVWGAQIDAIDNEGRSILQIAAAYGSVDIVQVLLARGLDEQHRDNQVCALPFASLSSEYYPPRANPLFPPSIVAYASQTVKCVYNCTVYSTCASRCSHCTSIVHCARMYRI